jgi:hypothetical protein
VVVGTAVDVVLAGAVVSTVSEVTTGDVVSTIDVLSTIDVDPASVVSGDATWAFVPPH